MDPSSESEAGEAYSISQVLFDTLTQKRFSENAIKKSIVAGCINEATCTTWIQMHEGHPELDMPLDAGVEVTIKAKRVLTESEREAKVKELRERIEQTKAEEAAAIHKREMKRIAMGKQAYEAKERLDSVRREVELEELRRQKAADEKARKRVKVQLLVDKYVRQGKSLSEAEAQAQKDFEAAEKEMQKKVADALKAKEEEMASTSVKGKSERGVSQGWNPGALLDKTPEKMARVQALFDTPGPSKDEVPALVGSLRDYSDATLRDQCLKTLVLILTNMRDHPFDIKRRSLKTTTNTFCKCILPHDDAVRLLRACNFDLVMDAEGNQMIVCTTVVMRLVNHALECLTAS